ncbi:DUF2087 domain-containing protein [Phyllobacterium ifriqiyense]|uniref:DUF2087 domain-containing protein n=1 Tax=Phyllobacterium ifriqiyense TaxID=314238 RepID=UPI0033987F04
MSRTQIPLHVRDTSLFAKSLRTQLSEHASIPSHLTLLNMLARAAGHGNFQSLRASAESTTPVEVPLPTGRPIAAGPDRKLVERVVRSFDDAARLMRWPSRRADQIASLWILWAQFPSAREMPERDVSTLLKGIHLFGDHALLRRELCDLGLVARNPSGSVYRRVERPMPLDAKTILRQVRSV